MLEVYKTNIIGLYNNVQVKSATMTGCHSRPVFSLNLDNGSILNQHCYDYYLFLLLHHFTYVENSMIKIKLNGKELIIYVDDQQDFLSSPYVNNYMIYLGSRIDKAFDIKTILKNDIVHTTKSKIQMPKLNVDLFNYQKNTIKWMNFLENNKNTYEFDVSVNVKQIDPNIQLDYYFNLTTKKITKTPDCLKFRTKGGILADEMGLGKTLMSICNCVVDKYDPKDKIVNGLFNSKATLIIAPSHLAHQWIDDMKKCSSKLNIICLTTKNDHKNLTFESFLDCDFVIATHQFLSNLTYYISIPYEGKKITATGLSYYDRKSKVDKMVKTIVESNKIKETNVLLEAFKWRRVVIDEGHELVGKMSERIENYLLDWITDIKTDFNWIVSGTPFTTKKNFMDMLDFIKFEVKFNDVWLSVKDLEKHVPISNHIAMNILQSIMNKNTKENTKDDTEIPDYKEELVKIIMTQMEKSLYDSKAMHKGSNTNLLRQLCCHPMIVDQQWNSFGDQKNINLDEIKEQLINNYKHRLTDAELKLKKLDPSAKEYNMLKKNFETIIAEASFLLKVFDDSNQEESESECPICRCPIDELVITKCGHKFCKDCIEEALKYSKGSKQCPLCASKLKDDEIYHKKVEPEDPDKPKVNPLISKYGSKLGTLISYCRKLILNPKNKIILFSQYDRMLQLIGLTLSENGVANTIIKGNVHQRRNAINKYKKGENIPVMLLSTMHTASGVNLENSTHIIFIDPIDGTIQDVKATENQAIGRVYRLGLKEEFSVIRMITSNTIEEDIWKKHNPGQVLKSTMVMDA